MSVDWAALVPEVTLRQVQVEALDAIHHELYVKGSDVVFLEAPTGVGKSIIQLALCRYVVMEEMGTAFMVTPQKSLQDQMAGWEGLRLMKGRGSYDCLMVHGLSAAEAPCLRNPNIRQSYIDKCGDDVCPYYYALKLAKESGIVLHNYASLMAQARIGEHFGPRSILCLDEGHTAASWIRNYMALELKEDDLQTLTNMEPPTDTTKFMAWFRLIVGTLMDGAVPQGVPDKVVATLMKIAKHAPAYGVVGRDELMQEYLEGGEEQDQQFEEWALVRLEEGASVPWHVSVMESPKDGRRVWTCIPIKVASMSWLLTGLGTKIVLVTATVLNKALLAAELGLAGKAPVLVRIDKAFDADRRPVIKRYSGNMTFREQARTLPKALDSMVEIAEEHKHERGIIHTVSHQLASTVCEELRARLDREVIQLPKGSSRDWTISKFLDGGYGEGSILVGPSLMEGLDAKYDMARWQVMLKVPWPQVNDPVVSSLLESKNPETRRWGQMWYTWKTAQQTVQGIGRVCRADDDYGVTYLLDAGFDRVLKSGYVPEHVLNSFVAER